MSRLSVAFVIAAGLIVGTLATPAAAQFDPLHNNLKCYQIKSASTTKTIVAVNQFGKEALFRLQPVLLCLPTQKICCKDDTVSDQGCVQVACNRSEERRVGKECRL